MARIQDLADRIWIDYLAAAHMAAPSNRAPVITIAGSRITLDTDSRVSLRQALLAALCCAREHQGLLSPLSFAKGQVDLDRLHTEAVALAAVLTRPMTVTNATKGGVGSIHRLLADLLSYCQNAPKTAPKFIRVAKTKLATTRQVGNTPFLRTLSARLAQAVTDEAFDPDSKMASNDLSPLLRQRDGVLCLSWDGMVAPVPERLGLGDVLFVLPSPLDPRLHAEWFQGCQMVASYLKGDKPSTAHLQRAKTQATAAGAVLPGGFVLKLAWERLAETLFAPYKDMKIAGLMSMQMLRSNFATGWMTLLSNKDCQFLRSLRKFAEQLEVTQGLKRRAAYAMAWSLPPDDPNHIRKSSRYAGMAFDSSHDEITFTDTLEGRWLLQLDVPESIELPPTPGNEDKAPVTILDLPRRNIDPAAGYLAEPPPSPEAQLLQARGLNLENLRRQGQIDPVAEIIIDWLMKGKGGLDKKSFTAHGDVLVQATTDLPPYNMVPDPEGRLALLYAFAPRRLLLSLDDPRLDEQMERITIAEWRVFELDRSLYGIASREKMKVIADDPTLTELLKVGDPYRYVPEQSRLHILLHFYCRDVDDIVELVADCPHLIRPVDR